MDYHITRRRIGLQIERREFKYIVELLELLSPEQHALCVDYVSSTWHHHCIVGFSTVISLGSEIFSGDETLSLDEDSHGTES